MCVCLADIFHTNYGPTREVSISGKARDLWTHSSSVVLHLRKLFRPQLMTFDSRPLPAFVWYCSQVCGE